MMLKWLITGLIAVGLCYVPVPWAALRGASGQAFADDDEIAVLPDSETLVALRSRPEPARDSAAIVETALVLGDPITHLAGLGAARREAREVAAFLGVEPRLGKRATEAAFWDEAPDAAILHVAAHGVYEAEHPLFSRLQLAEGDGHDGFLHVHEIWDRLRLHRNRLVVLSACETAAGEPTRGDDIVGLTQAFLVAGAPAVISTLWPVDDPASAALMTSFYSHFRGGATAGESLRRAQGELMRSERHSAPYYWAGYTLIGDPRTRWRPETEVRP